MQIVLLQKGSRRRNLWSLGRNFYFLSGYWPLSERPHLNALYFPPKDILRAPFGVFFWPHSGCVQFLSSLWTIIWANKPNLSLTCPFPSGGGYIWFQKNHVFLCPSCSALDHFYYNRWTRARTNRYYLSWAELCAKSILISRKVKGGDEGAGLH